MTGGQAPSPDTVNTYATENPVRVHLGTHRPRNHEQAVSVSFVEVFYDRRLSSAIEKRPSHTKTWPVTVNERPSVSHALLPRITILCPNICPILTSAFKHYTDSH